MLKLCQNSCTCEELVEADSLKLLFKIIASTCEQHNIPWRQTATDALLILTKNFNVKSINYIHSKSYIDKNANSIILFSSVTYFIIISKLKRKRMHSNMFTML